MLPAGCAGYPVRFWTAETEESGNADPTEELRWCAAGRRNQRRSRTRGRRAGRAPPGPGQRPAAEHRRITSTAMDARGTRGAELAGGDLELGSEGSGRAV
jgi:hypothetical protein